MRATRLLFALSTLTASLHAQVDFDLIVPQDVGFPGAGGSATSSILVNTGTEPIYIESWQEAPHIAISSQPFPAYDVHPVAVNWTVIQPGQAVGDTLPELMALLQPGEVLIDPSAVLQCELPFNWGESSPPQSAQVDVRIELLGRRLDVTKTLTNTGFWSFSNPVRVSSVPVQASVSDTTAGCDHPSVGPLPIHVGLEDSPPAASVQGYGSSLPVLGNEHFGFTMSTVGMNALVGSPWIFSLMPDTGSLQLFDCDFSNFLSPGLIQEFGVVQSYTLPFVGGTFMAPIELPMPIPATPALEGVALQAQWGIVTPTAANGVISVSPGKRLVLTALPG